MSKTHPQQSSNNINVHGQSAPASVDTRHLKVLSKIGGGHQLQSPMPVKQDFPAVPIAPVANPAVKNLPVLVTREGYAAEQKPLPHNLHRKMSLIRTPAGKAYALIREGGNPYALAIRSKKLNAIISELARQDGTPFKKTDLADLNDALEAWAEQYGEIREVWLRVATIEGGIEIDLGDDAHTRVQIIEGKVEIIRAGSDTLFFRTANTKAMAMPAATGDLQLLKKYLNVHATDTVLMTAWITYTLAHPKGPSSKYPILVLQGNEGSGKTSLCENIIIGLIDPSEIGVQVLPNNVKDLAIAGQNAHVLCFDNLRGLTKNMADMLCIAATGGTISTRQLYTDADQHAIRLHAPLVLNGIHQFIDQPDLAQRCLPIQLKPIDESARKSEQELSKQLDADLPAIMRGLFDLIASIFSHLPNVAITNPERMIDFVAWLAAMEMAQGVPAGVYQGLYSDTLQQGQLDTLMDNPLAAAIIAFIDAHADESWSGTPANLLTKLNQVVCFGTQRSREWPQNPIALSKRIAALQAGLLSQGIKIELSRGKQRTVTITKIGG